MALVKPGLGVILGLSDDDDVVGISIVSPRVRGRSLWTLAVALPKGASGDGAGTLRLQSSLVGTALELPPPLAKPAGEALPTTVQVGLPLGSGAIDVAFGERMALRARLKDGRTGVRVRLGGATVDGEPRGRSAILVSFVLLVILGVALFAVALVTQPAREQHVEEPVEVAPPVAAITPAPEVPTRPMPAPAVKAV